MIRKSNRFALVMVIFILIASGCSKQVLLKDNKLQKEQIVSIELKSGKQYSGIVTSVSEQTISIIDKNKAGQEIDKKNIARITGPQPWYDATGALISEKEITNTKTSKNFWLYTLSGSALSAGVSFFASSMIARSSGDDSNAPVITTGTVVGTVAGGLLFSQLGLKKDREDAIENIRLVRGSENLNRLDNEKAKQDKIQQEIDRLKNEREAQDNELEKLRQELEKK